MVSLMPHRPFRDAPLIRRPTYRKVTQRRSRQKAGSGANAAAGEDEMKLMALACALALAATHAQAATRWIGSWAAPPAPTMAAPANNPGRGTPTFNNQTLVQIVRLSAGGQRLRLRLSNEYGKEALAVGAARVALVDASGAVVPGSDRPVTFDGARTASLPPGAPLISDP